MDRPGDPQVSFDALGPYGFGDRVLALYEASLDEDGDAAVAGEVPPHPARVTRIERGVCVAVGPDGVERPLPTPVSPAVGDWLVVVGEVVHAVLPRWSALTRADPDGATLQVLAANVDLVIVAAPADRLSATRVERELALAWDSGAVPLVVVTKSDLDGGDAVAQLTARLAAVDVIAVSATTLTGVADLKARVAGAGTAVLLGPSGAGKSTLANALLGSETLATGAVRDGDARGRHTTTSRQLVVVPGGGVLIDTPGLRSLGLPGDLEVGASFPDVSALAAGCRFSDCRHADEPGCAVQAAVESGMLDPARLDSFQKLVREAAAERRRHDPLARHDQLRVFKQRNRDARAHEKRRRQ